MSPFSILIYDGGGEFSISRHPLTDFQNYLDKHVQKLSFSKCPICTQMFSQHLFFFSATSHILVFRTYPETHIKIEESA